MPILNRIRDCGVAPSFRQGKNERGGMGLRRLGAQPMNSRRAASRICSRRAGVEIPRSPARAHLLRARREQGGSRAILQAGSMRPEAQPCARSCTGTGTEAAVIWRGSKSARVRVLGTGEEITVRATDLWHVMPGHVVTVALGRCWRHGDQHFAEGEIHEPRIDVPALGLPPLHLEDRGLLQLEGVLEVSEGDPDALEPLRQLQAKIAATARAAYEMEQVLPYSAPGSGVDPILLSNSRKKRRDNTGAVRLLMDLLAVDLRCLDAHAHLGNFVFPPYPEHALIHYGIGAAIGEHALGLSFSGALPWSYLNNRPYLRCLHGQGLALWRLGRLEEAASVLERLLWLNPADDQMAARCWTEVQAGRPWLEEAES
jgi:hypothetical protein